ncbi:MAG: hypothetical protein J6Y71_10535 [Ruminococcus sp.]|nr:hypothetical protein [Ruminococcus sp.]
MVKTFFGRLADAAIQAAPIGSLLCMILFYITVIAAELLRVELSAVIWLYVLVALHIISISLMMFHKLVAGYHKYDQDIVGKNFVGLSKKCRIFSHALELHFNRRVNASLDEFRLLGSEYDDSLTESEKALVSFYTARCYDQLRYFPNALICYEKAAEQGFDNSILPFLRARCSGANGDTNEALNLYNEVLEDETSPFRNLVYNDIGRMYLDRNEPEEALKWYNRSISKRLSLAEAYGGAAIAQVMLGEINEGERLYREALLNHIKDPKGFTEYYRRILNAIILEKETDRRLKKISSDTM